MKKYIYFLTIFLQSCTQTGPHFYNCSQPELGELAIDISIENMENIREVVDRMNFSCKKEITYPRAACYLVRNGDANIGNRGLVVLLDEYIGECIIHELYHVELAIAHQDPCSSHKQTCYWDNKWLEPLLDEYKEIKNETN
jgi:hypothetical protein